MDATNKVVVSFLGCLFLYGLLSKDQINNYSLGAVSTASKKYKQWEMAARKAGVEIKPSSRKGKKLDVYKNGKYITSIGAVGYKDYWTYYYSRGKAFADVERKKYHARHKNNNGLAGKYAKLILW